MVYLSGEHLGTASHGEGRLRCRLHMSLLTAHPILIYRIRPHTFFSFLLRRRSEAEPPVHTYILFFFFVGDAQRPLQSGDTQWPTHGASLPEDPSGKGET